jgi:hypothetical protein
MILTPLIGLVLASLAPSVFSQIQYDSIHNVTPIVGSWSSGSKAVLTGAVSFLVVRYFFRGIDRDRFPQRALQTLPTNPLPTQK